MKEGPKPLEEQTAEELREYITGVLRPELKQRRQEFEVFDQAFTQLKPQEKRGLLHMISQFGENRASGAQLFRELSDTVLGAATTTPTVEENEMTEENKTDTEASTEPSTEVQELTEVVTALKAELDELKASREQGAEAEKAETVRQLKATATGFGLVEGTPQWTRFFEIAGSSLADGDLEKAKDVYEKLEGPIVVEGGEGEGTTETEGAEKKTFPSSGKAGGSGAPDADASKEEGLDFSSKSAVNDAARAFMESAASDNAATP